MVGGRWRSVVVVDCRLIFPHVITFEWRNIFISITLHQYDITYPLIIFKGRHRTLELAGPGGRRLVKIEDEDRDPTKKPVPCRHPATSNQDN